MRFDHPWVRALLMVAGSIPVFWIIYRVLLLLFSEEGRLSEFGGIAASILVGFWTGGLLVWLARPGLFSGSESHPQQHLTKDPPSGRAIGGPLGTVMLSVAWLGIWFYVEFLHGSFRAALFNEETIGVSLTENEAMRLATELGGLLNLGVTLPLFASSALIVGWAVSTPLRLPAMLVPAASFMVTAAVLNYHEEVLETGLPPIHTVLVMLYGKSEAPLNSGEIALLWLITAVMFAVGCLMFALYGRIWTRLGYWLRGRILRGDDRGVS